MVSPTTSPSPENSPPSPSSASQPPSPKHKSDAAAAAPSNRPVKRRASKACQSCRSRKVRCNVVEHGSPCTNCRLDEVPCVVTESRRRKKHTHSHHGLPAEDRRTPAPAHAHLHHSFSATEALRNGSVNPVDISQPHGNFMSSSHSVSSTDQDDEMMSFHVPHQLYHNQMSSYEHTGIGSFSVQPPTFHNLISGFAADLSSTAPFNTAPPPLPAVPQPQPPQSVRELSNGLLPAYIKPLPLRMSIDDVGHLWKKGALTIPDTYFRDALLTAYVEYVHPYMPLIELDEFLTTVDTAGGETGRISLLLFQAVMFAGVAFVDMSHLTAAGFSTRKAARKAFYLKARALYDFDYENDRVAIVQALLLMTYWYETPDDQKDTWHWMGVAISLAHTIGLHRNPAPSAMSPRKQKLWKRVWWSCFMRDRLVALGMRRPTRIKDEDFDVPMLTLQDFETDGLPAHILPECRLLRNEALLTDLAHLCIAKAKLCLCISHVLNAQYSVLIRDQGQAMGQDGNTRSSVMLFPKKLDQIDEVRACDAELADWLQSLPPTCLYRTPTTDDIDAGASSLAVQRALLHMCYHATLSALHRPQVLPSAETATQPRCRVLRDVSRRQVREASREITHAAQSLFQLQLARYLPTTGVTVLLPAIIIHLLDIKSPSGGARDDARKGFATCMGVLNLLRDNYAAADFATQFLGAAVKKAGIDVDDAMGGAAAGGGAGGVTVTSNSGAGLTPPPDSSMAENKASFWDVSGGSGSAAIGAGVGVGGDVVTPPVDANDVNSVLVMRGDGEEDVFEEQFGSLVDFGDGGGDGVGGGGVGGDMGGMGMGGIGMDGVVIGMGGMHGESGGLMMGIRGGMEGFGGGWGMVVD